MQYAYGQVVDIRKVASRAAVRVTVEIPAEFFAQAVVSLDGRNVVVTEATAEVAARLPAFGVYDSALPTEASPASAEKPQSFAKRLKLSGFFRAPQVCSAIGADAIFLNWVRDQPCALTGQHGHDGDPVVAAHVRRVSQGSGTGIKPAYTAIPLLDSVHREQHQQGEEHVWRKYDRVGSAKDGMLEMAIHYRETWAWAGFKLAHGLQSMGDATPEMVAAWAAKHNIAHLVPRV